MTIGNKTKENDWDKRLGLPVNEYSPEYDEDSIIAAQIRH